MSRLHLWEWNGGKFWFARGGIPENGAEALAMGYLLAVVTATGEKGISHSALSRAWLWMEHPQFFAAWSSPEDAEAFRGLLSQMWSMGHGEIVSFQRAFLESLERMRLIEFYHRGLTDNDGRYRRTSVACEPWMPTGAPFSDLAALVVPTLHRAEAGHPR